MHGSSGDGADGRVALFYLPIAVSAVSAVVPFLLIGNKSGFQGLKHSHPFAIGPMYSVARTTSSNHTRIRCPAGFSV